MVENKFDRLLNLQLFAGEGGAAGDAGDGSGDAGVNMQADAAPEIRRARRANPLANVKFGIQADEPAGENAQGRDAAGASEQAEETWESLKKGKYKAEYSADVKKALDGRYKETKAMQKRIDSMAPIIDAIADIYGIDVSNPETADMTALLQKVTSDQTLYREEALREGISVDMLMQRKDLERRQRALDAREQRETQENEARAELNDLLQQSVALKAKYPAFDVYNELENPAFARMVLKPPRGSGVPIETAYYAIHHDEIEAARRQQQVVTTQNAVQQTASMAAKAVASGLRRPQENGMTGTTAAPIRSDPRTLTKQERAEIRRRVKAGEKIRF